MRFLFATKAIRVLLALSVAFWMAGAGCMLGCENMVHAAAATGVESPANSAGIVAGGEACASMHSHDCCAKSGAHSTAKVKAKRETKKLKSVASSHKEIPAETNEKLRSVEESPASMLDCPLAVNATAVLSKAGADPSSVALTSSSDKESLVNSPQLKSAFARPLRLPNRGHTYLRCCVFLI